MERFPFIFLIAGIAFFALAFVVMAVIPIQRYANVEVQTMDQIAENIPDSFYDLADDYPEEFGNHFGQVDAESFKKALTLGKNVYIAEACWHCHSQFVRPVGSDELRFGRVSYAEEYQNDMNYPHLFGTRRVGPDLSREAGKHSNDWHVAHFFNPVDVVPTSVMPAYRWFFDENERPNEKGLAVIAYVQWLGSWEETVQSSIYNVKSIQQAGQTPDLNQTQMESRLLAKQRAEEAAAAEESADSEEEYDEEYEEEAYEEEIEDSTESLDTGADESDIDSGTAETTQENP